MLPSSFYQVIPGLHVPFVLLRLRFGELVQKGGSVALGALTGNRSNRVLAPAEDLIDAQTRLLNEEHPAMLRGVAQLARERGDGSLRFTPWQSLLLPDVHERDAAEVIHSLENLRLRCSADDALAHLIACTGSTGCGKGLSDTKGDALQLATLLQRHGQVVDVHLSGCARSCAAAHITPVTLLAVSPGHYDLYFRDAAQPGFGALHARNLTIEAVAALLDARSRSPLDA